MVQILGSHRYLTPKARRGQARTAFGVIPFAD
jgi:hypothetical protein